MKKCILAILFAIPSGLCWAIAGNLAVSNGGGFSFALDPGKHFEPISRSSAMTSRRLCRER